MKKETGIKLAFGAGLAWILLVLALNVGIIWAIVHFVRKYW